MPETPKYDCHNFPLSSYLFFDESSVHVNTCFSSLSVDRKQTDKQTNKNLTNKYHHVNAFLVHVSLFRWAEWALFTEPDVYALKSQFTVKWQSLSLPSDFAAPVRQVISLSGNDPARAGPRAVAANTRSSTTPLPHEARAPTRNETTSAPPPTHLTAVGPTLVKRVDSSASAMTFAQPSSARGSVQSASPTSTSHRAATPNPTYAHVGSTRRPSASSVVSTTASSHSDGGGGGGGVGGGGGGDQGRRSELLAKLRARGVHLYVAGIESKTTAQLKDLADRIE
jgi:hypothetical protein